MILSKELGKRDEMRGLPGILSLFRNKLNKINNTTAGMLVGCWLVLLLYVPSQQLWSLRDGQFT